jgi:hypothetical protein
MPKPAVEPYALALRREGILSRTKRGRGAEHATCQDAANMLLAMLSKGPVSAPEFVTRVGAFRRRSQLHPIYLQLGLNEDMLFKDAIAAVLSSYASEAIYGVAELDSTGAPSVELHVERPDELGRLKIQGKRKCRKPSNEIGPGKTGQSWFLTFGPRVAGADAPTLGIRSDRWLTGRAFFAVAQVISKSEAG